MLRITVLLALIATTLGAPKSIFNKPGGRIIGGEDADIADYPYQLSLQYLNFHFCGAVIISPSWAVTAGHCLADTENLQLSVRAGSSKSASGGQLIKVSRTILNEKYDGDTVDFDIGLLELEEPITVENASPVPLPQTNPIEPGAIASISGWGIDDLDDSSTPETLKVVKVPVIAHDECVQTYKSKFIVTDNMFCAGLLDDGGKDSCNGDSGGPVVIDNVLAGLVSWGGSGDVYPSCAEPLYPGVYTDVFNFVDWINENID